MLSFTSLLQFLALLKNCSGNYGVLHPREKGQEKQNWELGGDLGMLKVYKGQKMLVTVFNVTHLSRNRLFSTAVAEILQTLITYQRTLH